MLKEYLNEFVQNKNVMMFISVLTLMAGILAYFNNCAFMVSGIITAVLIILNIKRYISFKYVLLWAFIFYFGFFNASLRIKDSDALVSLAPTDAVIQGRIVSIPNSNVKDKTKFFFDVSKVNENEVIGKTLVTLNDKDGNFSDLKIGETYEISGKLRLPFKASNPSQFDYGKYLRNFKTHTVFYAEKENCKILTGDIPYGWKFMGGLNAVRNKVISTHSNYLKSPNLEILGGIVFGDDAVAPPDYIKDTFRNSGLLHILAASGMNVAFIYGFWYFILRRFKISIKFIIISGMGVVILYTFMTGLGASVVRAALMLLFVLAGKLIDRDSHSISLLAFVASLMLLYNPAYINDVGFQLSFIVTFGLLTTANVILEKIKDWKIPDWLCGELLIPIVAQLWVAPLQIFYFNTISTYSIPANISIMPFLSIISFGGFVSSVLAIITPIAKYVCFIFDFVLNFCLNALVAISNFFSNLKYSIIETTHPSVLQVVLYYIILLGITLMFKFETGKRVKQALISLIAILLISTIQIPNNNLEIISFDVQNADAFLIKTPKNKYFMIDTGKAPYNGGKSQAQVIVLKYMKDMGIKELEGIIITHFDNDHSGGAVDLMNNLKVKNVYINSETNDSMTSKLIYKTISEHHIRHKIPNNREILYKEGDLSLTAYMPQGKDDNEQSIINVLKYKDFEMLFMGDAGVDAFDNIKSSIPKNEIDVFKVGHHGAKGVIDYSMLNYINPKVSIISTGKNIFGHPNRVTLDVLRNTDIYRTDRNNSIKISAKKNKFKVFVYNIQSHRYKLFKKYTALSTEQDTQAEEL